MHCHIGPIANDIQRAISLRWEAALLPGELAGPFVKKAALHYKELLHSYPGRNKSLPPQYAESVRHLAALTSNPEFHQLDIAQALKHFQTIQREIVGELAHELQVAADGPKSAARPNEAVIKRCRDLRGPFEVAWIPEKRHPKVYQSRTMRSENHGPIDLLIKMANRYWEECRLTAQPVQKFLHLFDGVEVTAHQREVAKEIRDAYNEYSRLVAQYDRELRTGNKSPRIILTSAKTNREIEVTNLHLFSQPDSPIRQLPSMDVEIVENKNPKNPYKHLVVAHVTLDGKDSHILGTVSHVTEEKYRGAVGAGLKLTNAKAELLHGITKRERQAAGENVTQYIDMVRRETPPEERTQMAAALAQVSWQRTDNSHKRGSAPISIFPEEVMGRLDPLQAKELVVTGTRFESNQYLGHTFDNERGTISIGIDTNKESHTFGRKTVLVDGLRLGTLSSESPELPVGTQIEGQVTSALPNAVTLTSPKGRAIKVGQLGKGDLKHIIWNGETTDVTLRLHRYTDPRTSKVLPQVLASLGNSKLGILDRNDAAWLLQHTNLAKKGTFTLPMTLKSSASSTARITLNPDPVVYPWDKETQMEYERQAGRALYERYRAKVIANKSFANGNHRDSDVGVALLMLRDLPDTEESLRTVALALSQGNWVAQLKETLTPVDYKRVAKLYVLGVRSEALRLLHELESPEAKTLGVTQVHHNAELMP